MDTRIDPRSDTEQQSCKTQGKGYPVIADYYAEVPRDCNNRGRGRVAIFARVSKEKDDHEKHREDA
jgi:hypothetical protein